MSSDKSKQFLQAYDSMVDGTGGSVSPKNIKLPATKGKKSSRELLEAYAQTFEPASPKQVINEDDNKKKKTAALHVIKEQMEEWFSDTDSYDKILSNIKKIVNNV